MTQVKQNRQIHKSKLLESLVMVVQPKDVSFLFSLDDFESRMMKISGNDVISAKDFDLPVGWQRSKRDVQIRQILVFAAGL